MGMFDVRETALSESSEGKKRFILKFFPHSYFIFHEMTVKGNMVPEERVLTSYTTVTRVLATVLTCEPAHLSFRVQTSSACLLYGPLSHFRTGLPVHDLLCIF